LSPAPPAFDWTPGRARHTVSFVGDVESSVLTAEEWEVRS
jgi:hypothetical protein